MRAYRFRHSHSERRSEMMRPTGPRRSRRRIRSRKRQPITSLARLRRHSTSACGKENHSFAPTSDGDTPMTRTQQRSTGAAARRSNRAALPPLTGTVAVVAGATRGAGRGIARALGEAGATVYCTGRSMRGNPSPYKRPETIEETAEMINAAGGTAIAARVDHTVESEVEKLFSRIDREHRRVDVVVNSI